MNGLSSPSDGAADSAGGAGRRVPRAVVPTITLKSPKFTRKLTSEWFARRVDERYRRCLAKASESSNG